MAGDLHGWGKDSRGHRLLEELECSAPRLPDEVYMYTMFNVASDLERNVSTKWKGNVAAQSVVALWVESICPKCLYTRHTKTFRTEPLCFSLVMYIRNCCTSENISSPLAEGFPTPTLLLSPLMQLTGNAKPHELYVWRTYIYFRNLFFRFQEVFFCYPFSYTDTFAGYIILLNIYLLRVIDTIIFHMSLSYRWLEATEQPFCRRQQLQNWAWKFHARPFFLMIHSAVLFRGYSVCWVMRIFLLA